MIKDPKILLRKMMELSHQLNKLKVEIGSVGLLVTMNELNTVQRYMDLEMAAKALNFEALNVCSSCLGTKIDPGSANGICESCQ